MKDQFNTLKLNKELLINLEELKYQTMTPIQEKSLPLVLEGKDVIGKAKTGSGKTAAFALGFLNKLDTASFRIQAIVICPTRELAEQVAAETRKLARMMKNVKVLTLCGGMAEFHQEKSLHHGAHIVIGTPGRVLRLLKKNSLNLDSVKTLVLDEADRMLDMGFHDDITHIATFIPKERQTLLFSATFPENIKVLGQSVQRDATEIHVDVEHQENIIDESFFKLESHKDKNGAVLRILDTFRPKRLIIFCKTKMITDRLADYLYDNGIHAAGIHGDLEQRDRTTILTMFANNSLNVLVATDVAARGLDITNLEAVINYDLTNDAEVYVHRIGRTGRAGETGMAFSLYVDQEEDKLAAIEEYTGRTVESKSIETLEPKSDYNLIPEMKTMYINGGKKDKLRPGDIVGALIKEAGLESSDIGDINILNILSYVAIKRDYIDQAIDRLNTGKIKNRKFRTGHASRNLG